MQKWQILLEYLRWTKSFLSQRKAAIYMNRAREKMSNVENRIPQGYCSMKSDRTGAQTQTLLELHQMLYH